MSGSADLAEAYRAAVATRVIAMLTPSEASEVASAMARPPVVERAVVAERSLPLCVAAALVLVGAIFALLLASLQRRQPPDETSGDVDAFRV